MRDWLVDSIVDIELWDFGFVVQWSQVHHPHSIDYFFIGEERSLSYRLATTRDKEKIFLLGDNWML